MVISDTLVGSFLDVFFFLLAVILLGLLEKPIGGGSGVGVGRGVCGGLGVDAPFHPFSKALKCTFISF